MIQFLYKAHEKTGRGEGLKRPDVGKGFVWLHVTNPTKEEIKKLQKNFNISDLIFRRFYKEKSSVKYSLRPLAFTYVDYYLDNREIKVEDVLFIVNEHYLITITKNKLVHYDEAFMDIYEKLKSIPDLGHLLHEILDRDAESNFEVLDVAESKISGIEDKILSQNAAAEKIREVIQYKRYLLSMWRIWERNSKLVYLIRKGATPIETNENLIMNFTQLHDTYISQMELVNSQREALTDAITIYEASLSNRLASTSNRMNFTLKRLTFIVFLWTAIATILTIPNTLATIFGIWPESGIFFWPNLTVIFSVSAIIPFMWFLIYWKRMKIEYGEEIDFFKQKKELVSSLEKAGYIKDSKIVDAMLKVRREYFLPPEQAKNAYLDIAIQIPGEGRILAPHIHALFLSALDIKPGEKILEVGSGSGIMLSYARELVGKTGKVYGIESSPDTYNFCVENLLKAGYKDIKMLLGDGKKGIKDDAPFDKIVVSASTKEVPKDLIDQLAPGGLLIAPIGEPHEKQEIMIFEKSKAGKITKKPLSGPMFVPLKGKLG